MAYVVTIFARFKGLAAPLLLALARKLATSALGDAAKELRPAGLFILFEGPEGAVAIGEVHRFSKVVSASASTLGNALAAAGLKVDAGPIPVVVPAHALQDPDVPASRINPDPAAL